MSSSSQLIAVNDEQMYQVQKILEKKVQRGKALYLVKWKFWDKPEDLTWQPIENLTTVPDMIRQFQKYNKSNSKINEKKKIENRPKQPNKLSKLRRKQHTTPQSKKRLSVKSESEQQSDEQKSMESNSIDESSSCISIKKNSMKVFVPKISRINYLILKNNQAYFDCDVENQAGRCVGVMLFSHNQLSQEEPDRLIDFYEDYLIEASQKGLA